MKISYQLLFLACFCLINSLSLAASDSNALFECLSTIFPENHLTKIIVTDQNINFTSVLRDYIRNSRLNTSTTPKPHMILMPSQESEVPEIVTCAKNTGTYLKIRSGGHDYEGLSYTYYNKGTFAILDMFNLRSIAIDMTDQTVWVQAGATLGELYYSIWEKSKVHAFPAGVCPTIAVGGHITGGGYGNMMRKYGISADNVVDAKIVDANGRILDRKSMGEDLFWAIRGGGGASFGVILSYKINLVPIPPTVTHFNVARTREENATDLVYRWQLVVDKFDKELFVRCWLQPTDGKDGKKTVKASFIGLYLGSAENLVSLMKSQFPELGLKLEDCKVMTWIKAAMNWAGFPDNAPETALLSRTTASSNAFKIKSDYVKTPIPRDGWVRILEKIVASGNIWLMFNPYGGRMSEIPSTEIPFPHRAGNIYKIQYQLFWNETGPDEDACNINKLRDFYNYMTPFVSKNPRQAFQTYRDLDIGSLNNSENAYDEAKVYGAKYFMENFDRLVEIKTKVDPTNFFRHEQSIPLMKNCKPNKNS